MRYSLRNQNKIASSFGEDYLKNHIVNSLDSFFANIDDDNIIGIIELDACQTQSGEKYAARIAEENN